jgi:hypothetical protein
VPGVVIGFLAFVAVILRFVTTRPRSACFAAGGLLAGLLLIGAGASGYRVAMAINLASFMAR